MRCKKWIIGVLVISSLVVIAGSCSKDDDQYLSNISGNWRFLGALASNNCVAFSYLPLGTPFDLHLLLEQNGEAVTGHKTAGLLWSERPISECLVQGTYSGNTALLDALFTNIQAVTSPPFIFPTGVTSSDCVLQIKGGVAFTLDSKIGGPGYVVAKVSRNAGTCDQWLQPVPCEMKIAGAWTKMD